MPLVITRYKIKKDAWHSPTRFPHLLESAEIFFLDFSGLGKFWKISLVGKVLEIKA